MAQYEKNESAYKYYPVNWQPLLRTGDGIASATWVVPSVLSGISAGVSSLTAYIWLTGGKAGITYLVQNGVWTHSGTHDWTGFEVGVK